VPRRLGTRLQTADTAPRNVGRLFQRAATRFKQPAGAATAAFLGAFLQQADTLLLNLLRLTRQETRADAQHFFDATCAS